MPTGLVISAFVLTMAFMVLVVITGAFRRILTYVRDLILSFIIILLFILGIFQFLSVLP